MSNQEDKPPLRRSARNAKKNSTPDASNVPDRQGQRPQPVASAPRAKSTSRKKSASTSDPAPKRSTCRDAPRSKRETRPSSAASTPAASEATAVGDQNDSVKSPAQSVESAQTLADDTIMANDETDGASSESTALIFADIQQALRSLSSFETFQPRQRSRALRTLTEIRRHRATTPLACAVDNFFPEDHIFRKRLLSYLGSTANGFRNTAGKSPSNANTARFLPEGATYLSLLVIMRLMDKKRFEEGARLSHEIIEYILAQNRRSLDHFFARVLFYYSLFYELINKTANIRPKLLDLLRIAKIRHDVETETILINTILRSYLHDNLFAQADKFISKTQFPAFASNNQQARYLYYVGRVQAIKLEYTAACQSLWQAVKKAPQTPETAGFQQAVHRFAIIVQLLMGEIPERSTFKARVLRKPLILYLRIAQAVRTGDLAMFQHLLSQYSDKFRVDRTYTLVLRLRHNVIKTGIRMLSLSYSQISLRDVCIKLHLDSEQDAEFIVAKSIRDGVIDATVDHERGIMRSNDIVDVYSTDEPQTVFHQRIQFCLKHHNDFIRAMRFPKDAHRKVLEAVKKSGERMREIEQEIEEAEGGVDGDNMDDF